MEGREQRRVDGRPREPRLHRRSRARRLPGGDPNDQDSEITGEDGKLGIAIETGKTKVQRDTRGNVWDTLFSARG